MLSHYLVNPEMSFSIAAATKHALKARIFFPKEMGTQKCNISCNSLHRELLAVLVILANNILSGDKMINRIHLKHSWYVVLIGCVRSGRRARNAWYSWSAWSTWYERRRRTQGQPRWSRTSWQCRTSRHSSQLSSFLYNSQTVFSPSLNLVLLLCLWT